jgi:hypothetical protein
MELDDYALGGVLGRIGVGFWISDTKMLERWRKME